MTQPPDDLFGDRDGETFDPAEDRIRLDTQMLRTWVVMRDECWHVSTDIAAAVGDSWASVGARVRDFRKWKFGHHTVNKRRIPDGNGLWEYQLIINPQAPEVELDPAEPDPDPLDELLARYLSGPRGVSPTRS